ncbi:MAG: DNA-binding protein WhiA [Clostridia bacterium]|nr:DNA-binding protein WhiA [Clostridia bacterium]
MSFSLEVKNEICGQEVDTSCLPALLCGAILSSGSLVLAQGGMTFTISSENKTFIEYFKARLTQYYPNVSFSESTENVNFKQKERIDVKVDSQAGREILTQLGILSFNKDGNFVINRVGGKYLTIEENSKVAFLIGMFLGCGSLSIPEAIDMTNFSKTVKNSGYHMEWNVQSIEQVEYIRELLAMFDVISRTVERNDSYVVYIKEAEAISTLLGIFGAHKALLKLENERAGREMRNLVNRQTNCISANINKSVNTALAQLKAIESIRQTIGLEALPENLLEVALARIANPEGSLDEIREVLAVKVSKGAVSQRFKKIMEIAKEVE